MTTKYQTKPAYTLGGVHFSFLSCHGKTRNRSCCITMMKFYEANLVVLIVLILRSLDSTGQSIGELTKLLFVNTNCFKSLMIEDACQVTNSCSEPVRIDLSVLLLICQVL